MPVYRFSFPAEATGKAFEVRTSAGVVVDTITAGASSGSVSTVVGASGQGATVVTSVLDVGSYVAVASDERVFYSASAPGVLDVSASLGDIPTAIVSGSAQHVARQVLSASVRGIADTDVSALSPTVTLGTASAAPTIASGVRLAPLRLNSTTIDTERDPHFEYVGVIPGRLPVTSGDMTYADYLTGGLSQSRRNMGRVRFIHTGQAFEAYYRMRGTSFRYRILVDGLPLTADYVTAAVTTSSRYYLKVDFGSSASRLITLDIDDPEFGGVVIGPTDSIRRPERALLMVGTGDSHTAGSGGVTWGDTWPRRAAGLLGLQFANLGIGGSGYLNGTVANFRNRVETDIVPLNPDVVIHEGGWNDSGSTSAALQAEAEYVFGVLRESLPKALIIAAGPWVTSHNLSAILDTHDAALRAQAEASGLNGYISYRDPMNLKATAAAWAGSTAYVLGDVRTYNGFAQMCISAHTSTGSWDQTKWRSTAQVGGTGKVGTTAGNGNADVLVLADGVHGTALAHSVKGRHVAAEVLRIARAVAAGATWAG